MTPRAIFASKAPVLMRRLIERFHFKDFQAAGDAGNAGHESNGFTELHELGQRACQGGYGWYQWTGPRRVTFMAWCKTHGLDWTSDEANISYHLHELESDHATVSALLKTRTVKDAAVAFERNYERAGVPALHSRIQWAQWALEAYNEHSSV